MFLQYNPKISIYGPYSIVLAAANERDDRGDLCGHSANPSCRRHLWLLLMVAFR
jgi:hypothetical protein